MKPFLELYAVKVEQPLGDFYAVSIPANELKEITFSSRAKYKKSGIFSSALSPIIGTQRELSDKREKEISDFINTSESALPNSIIIGANVNEDGLLIQDGTEWYVENIKDNFYKIIIPTNKKMASIIDGQHRLNGTTSSDRKNMQLLCSIYIGLHVPYHAYLFATINANQKKVDRSLAYELYGFGLDDEPRKVWSPEKLAVYLVRRLNAKNSHLKKKVILGALSDIEEKGMFSLAALVDAIMSLFSSNPKKDRDAILYHKNDSGRSILDIKSSSPPLRRIYIDEKDNEIERIIDTAVDIYFDVLIRKQNDSSFIKKTVGVQAYFSFLKLYIKNTQDYQLKGFEEKVKMASFVDFSDDFYTSSGIGQSRMFNLLCLKSGLKKINDLEKSRDYDIYLKKLSEE